MARMIVGRQVAVALDKAESAIDAAVGEIARFAALLPEARQLLAQARGRLVETHRRLEALGRAMNVTVTATGPVDKPDEDGPRQGGGVELQRVSA